MSSPNSLPGVNLTDFNRIAANDGDQQQLARCGTMCAGAEEMDRWTPECVTVCVIV